MALVVTLVSAEEEVWHGEASLVVAKTVEGEIGFMTGHEPVLAILADKGFTRQPYQTPLEFAQVTGSPEVYVITETYNDVRFGNRRLEKKQTAKIEELLRCLSSRS